MDSTRRSFLKGAFVLVNAATSAALALPVLGFLLDPLFRRRQTKWIEAGDLAAFAGGIPKPARVKYTATDGRSEVTKSETFWIMAEAGNVVAFSSVCPHLGCTVSWRPEESRFFCPCHDGVFDREGKVLSGPPPKPMTRMTAKIENGKIFVRV